MTPERWRRVKEIVSDALEVDPTRRTEFVGAACNGDQKLQDEIDSLLRQDRSAASFVELPLIPGGDTTTFAVWYQFAPSEVVANRFRILRFIGRGGMGQVYEAKDLTLGSRVALKAIHPAIAVNPTAIKRFKREIRLAQKITHPNVCRVYDLAVHQSTHSGSGPQVDTLLLTMELLNGETLAERIRRRRLSTMEALPIARQIASALTAAHDAGVVHGDLKTSNVMLVSTGDDVQPRAVVMDFGLAASIKDFHEQTDTIVPSATTEGITGTPAYMAPEQILGEPISPATDIYSFGAVLYEMITGQWPFTGHTPWEVAMKRLQERPPSPRVFLPDVEPTWEEVILRCLARDPAERFGSALEVAGCLTQPHSFGLLRGRTRTARWKRWRWSAAVVLVGVASGLIGRLFKPSTADRPVRKLELAIPGIRTDHYHRPALSPDGRKIAYSAGDTLWVRDLRQLEPTALVRDTAAILIAWSPDSRSIAFVKPDFLRGDKLNRIALDAQTPFAIATMPPGIAVSGIAWDAQNRILVAGLNGIQEIPASGGEMKTLVPLNPGEQEVSDPSILPKSKGLLFVVSARDASTIGLVSNGARQNLLRITGDSLQDPVYSPSGHILFGRASGTIWALPFSLGELRKTGEPFRLSDTAAWATISSDGSTAVLGGRSDADRLMWLDPSGRLVEQIAQPQSILEYPEISPDGSKIAYRLRRAVGPTEAWVLDLHTKKQIRVSSSPDWVRYITWRRNSRLLIDYLDHRNGSRKIASISADGSGRSEEVGEGMYPQVPANNKFLVYANIRNEMPSDLFYRRLDRQSSPSPLCTEPAYRYAPRLSPDGRLVAYTSSDGLFVTALPGCTGTLQVTADEHRGRWNHDGTRIYFVSMNRVMEAKVTTRPAVAISKPRELFALPDGVFLDQGYDLSLDGQRFLVVGSSSRPPMFLVENWTAEFAKKK